MATLYSVAATAAGKWNRDRKQLVGRTIAPINLCSILTDILQLRESCGREFKVQLDCKLFKGRLGRLITDGKSLLELNIQCAKHRIHLGHFYESSDQCIHLSCRQNVHGLEAPSFPDAWHDSSAPWLPARGGQQTSSPSIPRLRSKHTTAPGTKTT